ncbi:ATP synthase delta chain [Clostridiaceae bacterium JG1575]|nr:ATP synthase delta chain [Clostridiaceae bacterium JG1575]
MYEFLDRRYAQALYDVAEAKGRVDKYIDDLTGIVKVIDESADFQRVIRHPEISTKEKKKFFINLFKGKIDEDLLTFLLILIEKDRILFLKEKLEELKKIDLEHRGTVIARIRTVQPLKQEQREELERVLTKKYHKKVQIDETVDPAIIGGMVVRVGDDLMDGSLRSSLEDIRQSMFARIEENQV